MAERCPFYIEYRVGSSAAADKPAAYCAHKHSVVRLIDVAKGTRALRCEGDLVKCEVPSGKQLDL